jgi:threo-3-hydroxy-L-aspartate ammonia-lyase
MTDFSAEIVLPTAADVRAAAERLRGVANSTPVMRSRTLDDMAGATVFLKCESFQRGGAFKFRGAFNFLSSLSEEERARGVCAISSGNHAQAVALSARELGIRAAILMPEDAPPAKLAAVGGYGAEIETYDRYSMPQVQAGREFAERRQMTFVPAYDDPRIAAGAGTAALELLEDAGELDLLLAPVGGGGLLSGCATVIKALHPGARVIGVEASGVVKRSLEAGERIQIPVPRHIADGQMLTQPGEWTFEVMRELVDDVVLCSDDEILAAMAFLFDRLKLVTEPSGAIATAALLAGHVRPEEGARVGVLISGGNVGLERFVGLMG